jgi:hypothetical protein
MLKRIAILVAFILGPGAFVGVVVYAAVTYFE